MRYSRYSKPRLLEALSDTPAVLIHGARQCGKTTLAQELGEELGYRYISFDDENQRQAAKFDPVGFTLALSDKVILDEVQRVPELFLSLKQSIDKKRVPGRFILTGSANVLFLPNLADSLAGRMEILHLRPLARCEISGAPPLFLKSVFQGDFQGCPKGKHLGQRLSEIICQGGFPAALVRETEKRRSDWYRDYAELLVQRDVRDLANIRNLEILPRLLDFAASQTAHLFNLASLAAPFALSRQTIREYLLLLEQIFLLEILPPWHSNRLSRLIKTPKLHLSDTGLAVALLGIQSEDLWNDKPLLGQLLETCVYQELRKQADWQEKEVRLFHFRDKDKVEVDIVLEQGRKIAGIEVKAAATVTAQDFKGLKKLKEAGGENFSAGVLLYDGEDVLPFGEKLFAAPLSWLLD
jgi:predicted AAA+ superfamily ATPase